MSSLFKDLEKNAIDNLMLLMDKGVIAARSVPDFSSLDQNNKARVEKQYDAIFFIVYDLQSKILRPKSYLEQKVFMKMR
jgi:hypothetical protein